MSLSLQGTVIAVTFQNDDNGYTVLQLQADGELQTVTCVGTMPTVSEGESLKAEGSWEEHRRFGRQFNVDRYEIIRPTTVPGITLLLGSGLIAGIGPVRAKIITERFGLATLDILDNDAGRLREVRGIGPKTLARITESWQRQRHIRDLVLFLQEIGAPAAPGLAARIYRAYGPSAKERISADPYALLDDVWGVGFIRADRIAQRLGFKHDSYKRIRAGIMYALSEAASGEGHSFLPAGQCVEKTSGLLGVPAELVLYALDHTVASGQLVRENDLIYLPSFHTAEQKVAEFFRERTDGLSLAAEQNRPSEHIAQWLDEYRRRTGWQPDPKQSEAIATAVTQPLMLLTGGPGTGKTNTLQVIVSYFRSKGTNVMLAAPTGRAAQRMGSLAGLSAQTIHRLLEFKGSPEGYRFLRNGDNPIAADVLIVDEMSMIDILLMRSLLSAVPPSAKLILVGDSNQLPSVGAGNVLADLIACGRIPHAHLTTVFRQAASSRIVTAAHEIIAGKVPKFTNAPSDDCFFIVKDEPEACVTTIVDLVSRRLPARYGFDPVLDIQVLSPMHKGPLGTANLTAVLQNELVIKNSIKRLEGNAKFFLGDKVMQVRNNYDLGVFNGDIGIVTALDDDGCVSVGFDGMTVRYSARELDELVPAYCMSIHKSQGCEFKAVIVPLATQHYILLQRNLIYTALTRARHLCVFVGTFRALALSVRNDQAVKRYSSLAHRLMHD
ncbi:MAG: ATP-dependent RecD-like DNA helicase [Chitinispirillaceae bacterium]|nr:ATP-dependent RecD-like DNA helicase [Chitinispirillaceae bacterium]